MTDAKKLWTAGSTAPAHFDAARIAAGAEKFTRDMRSGILRENLAGLVVVGFFGVHAAVPIDRATPLTRVGSGLIVLGCAVLLAYLNVRGRVADAGPEASTLSWYRGHLRRWATLHRTVVRWYLGPLMPGVALFLAGMVPHVEGRAGAGVALLLSALTVVAVFALVAWRNLKRARVLDAELAALPIEASPSSSRDAPL